jgi:biotin operon repressor|tara:strand:- start:448 stop:741 length:294 start_codon:yes stop_codon:yes gene_type:complete
MGTETEDAEFFKDMEILRLRELLELQNKVLSQDIGDHKTWTIERRNLEIFRLRKQQYLKLQAIGDRFDLSKERVRMIVKKMEEKGFDVQNFRPSGDR